MAVRPGTFSGVAYISDNFTAFYFLTPPCFYTHHMSVNGFVPITVINNYVVTITTIAEARFFYGSVCRGINGCALRGGRSGAMRDHSASGMRQPSSATGGLVLGDWAMVGPPEAASDCSDHDRK